MSDPSDTVVILGGGIIGFSIAYYLSQAPSKGQQIHIVDADERLFESASGYAGGFLARDWFPAGAAALGELSFAEHRRLAAAHNGQQRWGYSGSHVYSLSPRNAGAGVRGEDWLLAGTSRAEAAQKRAVPYGHVSAAGEAVNQDGTPAWIRAQENADWTPIAGIEDCAQVEPRRLCEFLLSECKAKGVKVHLGTRAIDTVVEPSTRAISALHVESTKSADGKAQVLPCNKIVIAAGCWSPSVFKTLFPQSHIDLDIDSLGGHSIIYRSPRYVSPFKNIAQTDDNDPFISYAIYSPPMDNVAYSPEAYARLDGQGRPEIWIGGLNHTSAEMSLPHLPSEAKKLVSPEKVAHLRKTAVRMTGSAVDQEDDLEVVSAALCFRPIRKQAVPIISEVSAADLGLSNQTRRNVGARVWVASGHGPWGISLSLGTGMVMSDLLSGRRPRVDLSATRINSKIMSKL